MSIALYTEGYGEPAEMAQLALRQMTGRGENRVTAGSGGVGVGKGSMGNYESSIQVVEIKKSLVRGSRTRL